MDHYSFMTIFLYLFFWMGAPLYTGETNLHFGRCPLPNTCTNLDGTYDVVLQPGQVRAEISDPKRTGYGEPVELTLEIFVPTRELLENQNGSIVLAQFHAENSQSPVLALRLKSNGDCQITLRHLTETDSDDSRDEAHEVLLYKGPFTRGHWHSLAASVRTGPTGEVRVRLDESPVADYQGPVGYRDRKNYFKFGLYDYTASFKQSFRAKFRNYNSR